MAAWDVVEVPLEAGRRLVHLTLYYMAYWQARRGETGNLDLPPGIPAPFPRERELANVKQRSLPSTVTTSDDLARRMRRSWAGPEVRTHGLVQQAMMVTCQPVFF